MAKANIVLANGTKVTIEGTPAEVSTLVDRLSPAPPRRRAGRGGGRGGRHKVSGGKAAKPKRAGPTEYIRELKADGFFKTKREIGDVRDKLEEAAHIYKVTSLSAPLFRLVKNRELRRIKEDGAWKYLNP